MLEEVYKLFQFNSCQKINKQQPNPSFHSDDKARHNELQTTSHTYSINFTPI